MLQSQYWYCWTAGVGQILTAIVVRCPRASSKHAFLISVDMKYRTFSFVGGVYANPSSSEFEAVPLRVAHPCVVVSYRLRAILHLG